MTTELNKDGRKLKSFLKRKSVSNKNVLSWLLLPKWSTAQIATAQIATAQIETAQIATVKMSQKWTDAKKAYSKYMLK